jgi:hypothetical protein
MSPLDALSPDQRAVIQLVLQQERSYEDLATLLGIAVEGVRTRAVAGMESIAPAGGLSGEDRGFVTDFLLGQLTVSERESARSFLASTPEAREWALAVSLELAGLGGDALPQIPDGPAEPIFAHDPEPADEEDDEDEHVAPAAVAAPAPLPRPRPRPQPEVTRAEAERRPHASRLGGALLILGAALVVAAVLYAVLRDDGGDGETRAATPTATPTATAAAGQQEQLFAIPLEPVGDSKAKGTLGVFRQEQQIFFALEAESVPQQKEGEAYAIWLIGGTQKPRRLGYFQEAVQDGRLGTIGPDAKDVAKFPEWLSTYKRMVISRETRQNVKQPGPIILSAQLPGAGA